MLARRLRPNAVLMLARRLRRRPNIKTTSRVCWVTGYIAGMCSHMYTSCAIFIIFHPLLGNGECTVWNVYYHLIYYITLLVILVALVLTRGVHPMLVIAVCDAGPTPRQHWVNVSCLLGSPIYHITQWKKVTLYYLGDNMGIYLNYVISHYVTTHLLSRNISLCDHSFIVLNIGVILQSQ